ncbi:hypothetical protein BH09PAT2_BH09PAT2_04960 [soil metagenome]
MENIYRPITTVLVIIVIGVIAFMGMRRVDRYLNMKAIHECAEDYRQEITDPATNTRKIRPLEQQVKDCAWQKGVHTGWEGVWGDLL